MTLTIYDGLMAGVVVAGMIWGALRGMTWQLASIASLVLGYLVSHQVSGQVASHFPGDPAIQRALAMLAVYAGVSGGVFLVAWIFRAALRKMKFEAWDRHLGMLLGGLEGALLGVVVTFFTVSLAPSTRDPIFASPSGKVVGNVMNAVGPVLPTEVRDALGPFIAEAKRAVDAGETIAPLIPNPPADARASAPTLPEATRTGNIDDGTVERR